MSLSPEIYSALSICLSVLTPIDQFKWSMGSLAALENAVTTVQSPEGLPSRLSLPGSRCRTSRRRLTIAYTCVWSSLMMRAGQHVLIVISIIVSQSCMTVFLNAHETAWLADHLSLCWLEVSSTQVHRHLHSKASASDIKHEDASIE